MTTEGNGTQMYMPVAPAYGGGNGFGMGGDCGSWIILFLIFGMFGGWGNGNGFGGGGDLYPWMNQQNQMNDGFQNQMLNTQAMGIQNAVTAGFGDVQNSLCGGFAGVTAAVTGAQNALAQQLYTNQIAGMQQNFAMQQAFNDCCCENRLANCQTQNIIQNEGNQTRFADANNTRDLLTNQTANTQAILDKLCQLELDGKNTRIADLERQLTKADLLASQTAQNAFIQQGFSNEVDALYNRLNTCPVPTTPVYGRTPIFQCGGNGGCGCSGNTFYN